MTSRPNESVEGAPDPDLDPKLDPQQQAGTPASPDTDPDSHQESEVDSPQSGLSDPLARTDVGSPGTSSSTAAGQAEADDVEAQAHAPQNYAQADGFDDRQLDATRDAAAERARGDD